MSESQQSNAQNAIQRMMLLPAVAKNRFQETAELNQQLSLVAESQNLVIEDLAVSIPDLDEIVKKTEEVDQDLEKVDQMLLNSNHALLELLTTNSNKPASAPGAVLSSVISNVQRALFDVATEAAGKGQTNVNLLHLIDIEDQVSKLIENMMSRNMYPESEDGMQKRVDYISQHNQKIVQFLQIIKSIQEKQAAAAAPQE